MAAEPTTRQLEILEYMRAYQREHRMPPTMREIAKAFGFASTHSAVAHMQLLAKKGLVTHRPGIARGWVAVESPSTEVA